MMSKFVEESNERILLDGKEQNEFQYGSGQGFKALQISSYGLGC